MTIQVIEHQSPAELSPTAQVKNRNEPTAIQPEHVWDQLTSQQQRQVMRSLVQVGRQLLEQVMAKEAGDEHN